MNGRLSTWVEHVAYDERLEAFFSLVEEVANGGPTGKWIRHDGALVDDLEIEVLNGLELLFQG